MPFKNKEEMRKQKRRFRSLEKLKKHDSKALILCLSSASEKPILTRIVGIDFKDQEHTSATSTKEYSLHLSILAAQNLEKYIETLKAMNFCYKVFFGDYYLIKLATEEEVETFEADRIEKLKEFLNELKKAREGKNEKNPS